MLIYYFCIINTINMARRVKFYANAFQSTPPNGVPIRNYCDAGNQNELFVFKLFCNGAGNLVILDELQGKDLNYCITKLNTLLNPNRQLVVRIVSDRINNYFGGFLSVSPRNYSIVINIIMNQLIVLNADVSLVNKTFKAYVYDINSILPNAKNINFVNFAFPNAPISVNTTFQNTGFVHRIQSYLNQDISNFDGITALPTAGNNNYIFYELDVYA